MARPIAKLLGGFFIAAAVLLVVALALTLGQPAPVLPPMPNPNGYDDFIRASDMVLQDAVDYSKMSLPELQAATRHNEETLKLVKLGLSRECRAMPINLSPTNSGQFNHLTGVKRLAQALAATGRLAELEQRPADAAEAYVTVIRLGNAISQGGMLIDLLVGVAIQRIGSTPLEELIPKLDAGQCRRLAAALEASEQAREPMATALARDQAWAKRAYGFKGQLARLLSFRSVRQSEQRATARVQSQASKGWALAIRFAARAYELEQGQRPPSLAALVPAYLRAVPQDPLTGKNMSYQP